MRVRILQYMRKWCSNCWLLAYSYIGYESSIVSRSWYICNVSPLPTINIRKNVDIVSDLFNIASNILTRPLFKNPTVLTRQCTLCSLISRIPGTNCRFNLKACCGCVMVSHHKPLLRHTVSKSWDERWAKNIAWLALLQNVYTYIWIINASYMYGFSSARVKMNQNVRETKRDSIIRKTTETRRTTKTLSNKHRESVKSKGCFIISSCCL